MAAIAMGQPTGKSAPTKRGIAIEPMDNLFEQVALSPERKQYTAGTEKEDVTEDSVALLLPPTSGRPPVSAMQCVFLKAAEDGNTALVRQCVSEQGVKVDTVDGPLDDTGLHLAMKGQHLDTCRCLVTELGIPIDARNSRGDTALHHAASQGLIEATRVLIVEVGHQ